MQGETNDAFIKMVQEGKVDLQAGPLEQPTALENEQMIQSREEPQQGDGDWEDPDFIDNKTFHNLPDQAKRALGNRLKEVREERARNAELMQKLADSQQQIAGFMERMTTSQEESAAASKPKYNDKLGHRPTEEIESWAKTAQQQAYAGLASDDSEQRAAAVELMQKVDAAKEILNRRSVQDLVGQHTQPLQEQIKAQQAAAQRQADEDARWLQAFGREALSDDSPTGPKAQAAQMVQNMIERGALDPTNGAALDAASFAAMMAVTQGGTQQRPHESIRAREGLDLGGGPGHMGNAPRNAIDAAAKRGDYDAAIAADLEAELKNLL